MNVSNFSELLADNLRLQEAIHQAQLGTGGAGQSAIVEETRQAFVVSGMRLMVRYDESSELTDPLPIAMLPGVPEWFLGVCNLHGLLTPVFDLANFLGLPAHRERRDKKKMMLVLGHGADAAAIYIDGLPKHIHLNDTQIDDMPLMAPANLQAHIRAAYYHGQNSWWDISVPKLLATIENELQQTQEI